MTDHRSSIAWKLLLGLALSAAAFSAPAASAAPPPAPAAAPTPAYTLPIHAVIVSDGTHTAAITAAWHRP